MKIKEIRQQKKIPELAAGAARLEKTIMAVIDELTGADRDILIYSVIDFLESQADNPPGGMNFKMDIPPLKFDFPPLQFESNLQFECNLTGPDIPDSHFKKGQFKGL